ncbi:hypothetical protein BDDG_12725, partial [Blastomyces dermatitidis ATCC 18188]
MAKNRSGDREWPRVGNREWPRIGAYVESVECNGIVYMIDRGGGRGSAIENGRGSAIENGRGSE